LALVLAALPLVPAAAQEGGPPFWHAPPPVCHQLLAYRDETQKAGQALQVAERAPAEEICSLFKAFLAAETGMLEGLETHRMTCRVPTAVIEQVKTQHVRAGRMAEQVCARVLASDISLLPDAPTDAPMRQYAPAPLCGDKTLAPGAPCL
jgi:hypothetical protein